MGLQDRIEKFLQHNMTKAEEQAFRLEMEKNEELAQKVAYNKELMEFFEEREPALKNTLNQFGDKYFVPKNNKLGTKKWLIILPSLLLVAFLIYYLTPKNNTTSSSNNNTIIIPVEKDSLMDKPTINESTKPISEPTENPSNIEQSPDSVKENNKQIAVINPADFRPNPALENLIKEPLRDDNSIVITKPAKGKQFDYAATINLELQGSTEINPPFQFFIYSNKKEDFYNDNKLLNVTLQSLNFNANLSLNRGLYYYIIQEKSNEEILFVSKFSIK